MIYSYAMFLPEEDSLETAQVRKMQTILNKADIRATDETTGLHSMDVCKGIRIFEDP